MTENEIKEKVADLNKRSANPSLPASAVAALKKMIDGLEAQLPKEPKPEPKKKVVEPKPAKKAMDDTITVNGKEFNVKDCHDAMEAWKARKKQHDEAAGKYKTKPVMTKVADNVTTIVNAVVEAIPENKTPVQVETAVKAMKAGFEKAFKAIEDILGKKMNDANVKKAFEAFKEAVKNSKE